MVFSNVNPANLCTGVYMQQGNGSRMERSILLVRELRASQREYLQGNETEPVTLLRWQTPARFLCLCAYIWSICMYEVCIYICIYISFPPEWLVALFNCENNNSSWVNAFQISLPLGITFKKWKVWEICGTACSFDPDSLIKTILLLLFPQRFAIL